jgi:hypothetical protein
VKNKTAFCVCLIFLVLPSSADIIFDNIGLPGPGGVTVAGFFIDGWSGRSAIRFSVQEKSYRLDSISMPIVVESGNEPLLRVRLAEDVNDLPGNTLEVLSENQNIWPTHLRNAAGGRVAPGTYFIRLQASGQPLLTQTLVVVW